MAEKDDKARQARKLQSMLMDAMHAMVSMEEIEQLTGTASAEDSASEEDSPEPESIIGRLAGLPGSAMRFATRSTDMPMRVGRALMNSRDQLRLMLAAGDSLQDIREVAGLTLSEMSQALNLKDKSVLKAIEDGTSTLSFELILRLAALVARNDPIPFIMRATRHYNPEVWELLNDWGVGKLPLQFERERQFINIFRSHDGARNLSDEGFGKVLEFTRQSFEMSLHFIEEQEQATADLRARYENREEKPAKSKRSTKQ